MCIPDSRWYGLTLAWVTSENSTMLLESDILRLFFTGPYLVSSPLCSVSGVDCPSVDPRQLPLLLSNYQLPLLLSNYQLPLLLSNYQLPLSGPTTNCVSLVLASLWVASSTLIRLPVPLPGTARFHVHFHHFSLRLTFLLSCPLEFFPLPGVVWEGIAFASNRFFFKSTKKQKLSFLPNF